MTGTRPGFYGRSFVTSIVAKERLDRPGQDRVGRPIAQQVSPEER
jgi:hypothetical protein